MAKTDITPSTPIRLTGYAARKTESEGVEQRLYARALAIGTNKADAVVLVTLKPPPTVLYEVRRSMLDRLLGRTFFIPASIGYVLSDDAARLLVPDITAEIASPDAKDLGGPTIDVRIIPAHLNTDDEFEEETVLREPDEDATVLRQHGGRNNEDDTLIMPTDEGTTH